jgi:hypothetical protein
MANYRAALSPSVALKVLVADVTYDTEQSLYFIRGLVDREILESGATVGPGDAVTAVAALTVVQTGAPITGALITFYITAPGGAAGGTMTAITNAQGLATVDITTWINNIASSGAWGVYSFQSRFAGITPAAGLPGFYASEAKYDMGYGIGQQTISDYTEAY